MLASKLASKLARLLGVLEATSFVRGLLSSAFFDPTTTHYLVR